MKRNILVLLALVAAAPWNCPANIMGTSPPRLELANELPPGGLLRGETVYVVVGQTESRVEAVFDVSDFPPDTESLLLPIFARAADRPAAVVEAARVRASLNGTSLGISVANSPPGSPALPDHLQFVWARIEVRRAFLSRGASAKSLNLRVSYVQKHVDRTFYYLAQSIPSTAGEESGHNWRYPLIAHAGDRSLVFAAGDCSWERLGNALIVYLKSDQIVAIQAK